MQDYYNRFPAVLKQALIEGRVEFPQKLIKEYEPITAYRGIRYVKGKKEYVEKNDFLSQVERELPMTDYDNIDDYSCSCFEDVEELKLSYRLPRKNKGIAKGNIVCEKGPIARDEEGTHIHWFLFDGVDPSEGFEVYSHEEMDGD